MKSKIFILSIIFFSLFYLPCVAQDTIDQQEPAEIIINPKEKQLLKQANGILKKGDNPELAIVLLNEALKIKPDFVTALNNKGWALVQLERYTEAVEVLDRCIELADSSDNNLPSAYGNQARAYAALGKYSEAIGNYGKIIAMNPKQILAYKSRSIIYDNLGNLEDAVADNKKIIEIASGDPVAYRYIARVYGSVEKGEKYVSQKEALAYAKKAVDLERSAENLDTLAAVYARSGMFKEAVTVEKEAYGLSEDEQYKQLIAAYQNGINYIEWQKSRVN